MSAVYWVGGESDATDIALSFSYGHHRKAALATRAQCKHCIPLVGPSSLPKCAAPSRITLPGKPQSEKPRVRAEPGEPKALSGILQALAFTHGFLTSDDDRVGIMNNAVADGVSQNRICEFVPPAGDVKLGAKNRGRTLVP